MWLQHRKVLTAFEADEMVGRNRPLHWHSRFSGCGDVRWTTGISEGTIDVINQRRHISGRNRVVGDVRRDDLRRKDEQLVAVRHLILG